MAFTLAIADLPGYSMAKKLYDAFPGRGKLKKIIVGALAIGAVAVVASIGIIAIVSVGAWLLALPALVALGVIVSFVALFTFAIAAIRYVLNFNFAISDEEIEKQIKESFNQFYGTIGETAGKSLGYLVCGALPGSLLFAFNPTVAAVMFSQLGSEAQDEILGNLAALSMSVLGTIGNALALKGFKSARKWAKRPDSPVHDMLKKAMGKKRFEEWGKTSGKNWTINGKIEERVEAIKDPRLRSFTQSVLEGFSEGCITGGIIYATNLDSHMAAHRLMNRRMGLDPDEELVRITVNARSTPTPTPRPSSP